MTQGYISDFSPSSSTGSGIAVRNTAPTINQANIVGVTNGSNATAGSVGEFISSVIPNASSVSISSNSGSNVTSISLTAGEWLVWGNVNFKGLGSVINQMIAWVSTTSATLPDTSLYNNYVSTALLTNTGIQAPYVRISVSGTTTVYLSCFLGNTSGSGTANGGIYARRVR